MSEIQLVSPSLPVVKPKKIKKKDNSPEQQRRKKQELEQQNAEPIQHIDEIA